MKRRKLKITMLWKFFFWFIVWFLVFLPGFIMPITLSGVWLFASRFFGALLLLYSLFLSSSGGRVLARYAHQEAHETFWPDKFTEFGIFGCMRHSMHMGLAIFPVSIALLSGLILPILSSGWGVAAAFWFVLQIEEKDALSKYGQTYTDYMLRVPPFSLSLECIKAGLEIWKK